MTYFLSAFSKNTTVSLFFKNSFLFLSRALCDTGLQSNAPPTALLWEEKESIFAFADPSKAHSETSLRARCGEKPLPKAAS